MEENKTLLIKTKTFFHQANKRTYALLSSTTISDVFLYLFVILYPISPSYFSVFGFRFSSIIAILSFFFALISRTYKTTRFSAKQILFSLLVFFFISLPSVVSNEFLTSGFLSVFVNYFLAPLFVCLEVTSKEKMDKCLRLLIITGLVIAFFSFFELFGFNIFKYLETDGGTDYLSGKRFGIMRTESGFVQSIAYAIYLSFLILASFYELIRQENRASSTLQNFYLVCLTILNVALAFTISRFPILVCSILEIFLFFLLTKKTKIKILLIGGVIGLLIAVFSLITGNKAFVLFFQNLIEIFTKGSSSQSVDNPLGYRLALFEYVKKVVGNEFLFGVGIHPNTTYLILNTNGAFQTQYSFDNAYLYMFIGYGLVGCLGWMFYYFGTLYIAMVDFRRTRDPFFLFACLVLIVCLLNFVSVARLDEAKTFSVFLGLFLGKRVYENDSSLEKYENLTI